MDVSVLKINGLPGFGFPGEIGEKGENGKNIFFSNFYYKNDSSTSFDSSIKLKQLRFDSDKAGNSYYAAIDSSLEVHDGDWIIISGKDSTGIYEIKYNSDSTPYIIDDELYRISPLNDNISFFCNVEISGDGTNKIILTDCVLNSTNPNSIKLELIAYKDASFGIYQLKDFNEELKQTYNELKIVYSEKSKYNFYIYAYIKETAYKIRKKYLYKEEL